MKYFLSASTATMTPTKRATFLSPMKVQKEATAEPSGSTVPAMVPARIIRMGSRISRMARPPGQRSLARVVSKLTFSASWAVHCSGKNFFTVSLE